MQHVSKRLEAVQASGFGDHDAVLRELEARLLEHLAPVRVAPRRVLDLGAGAGAALPALRRRFPGAEVIAVDARLSLLRAVPRPWLRRAPPRLCADPVHLPLAAASVDVVVSNLALSRVPALDAAISELARVAAPDALVAFTLLGPDALAELRGAWQSLAPQARLPAFPDLHVVGDLLVAAGFTGVVMDVENLVVTYPDAAAALRELRALDAVNRGAGRPRGLRGSDALRRLAGHYPVTDAVTRVSLEITYAHAWRAPPPGSQPVTLA